MSAKFNTKEQTNVPDYQKLSSAAAAAGVKNEELQMSGWDPDVEMLVPSPIIHPPGSHQHNSADGPFRYGRFSPLVSEHKKTLHINKIISRNSFDPQQHNFTKRSSTLPSKYSYTASAYEKGNSLNYRSSYNDGISSTREIPSILQSRKSPVHHEQLYSQDRYRDHAQNDPEFLVNSQRHDQWKASPNDLRAWQQQHQEELLHQHLEADALYQSPSNQPSLTDLESKFKKVSMDERWEPVRRAADSIIREKNMIIEKLKNRIFQLEEDCNALESKLRQSLLSKDDSTDVLKHKLQELQHKNTSMKELLNEERAKKHSEIDDLEVKLGATEYEVKQLKSNLDKREEKLSEIQQQLIVKTEEARSWKEKFSESCNSHLEMKKKLDSIQRYFEELPTLEESKLQAQELFTLKEEVKTLKSRNEELEKKNNHLRKIITARDFKIHELEEEIKELKVEIETAHHHLEALGYTKAEQELKQVSADKEKMTVDLDKAKKLLETTLLKLKNVEIKHQVEIQSIQEKLTREEEIVITLKADIASKEEQMEKMKKTIKEIGSQNQDFLQQSLMCKEEMRSMESHCSPATRELQQSIMIQLSYCFSELRALVQICMQRLQGEDPDISLLLGLKDTLNEELVGAASGKEDTKTGSKSLPLGKWLSIIKDMRKEMNAIRTHICNKYAEDMGDNMACATQ